MNKQLSKIYRILEDRIEELEKEIDKAIENKDHKNFDILLARKDEVFNLKMTIIYGGK